MARRSLAKRILRSLQKFKKTSINKGRALEAAIARYTEELVGPEVTNHVKCCNEQGVECACAKARELAWKTHVACIPYKITRFKTEFNTFRTKIASPGDITVGELAPWPLVILGMIIFATIGVWIGRGSIYGYSYEEYKDRKIVVPPV